MFTLLQIIATLSVGFVVGTFTSDAFAYEVSRVIEALFDFIEYKFALWDERRVKEASAVLCSARERAETAHMVAQRVAAQFSL